MAARPLNGEINKKEVFCLNESKGATHDNLFIGDRRLVCRSDADSQLLLHVPFNQTVKLTGVQFDAPEDEHPTIAKIFVNSTPMGFDEAEEAEAAQVLDLKPSDFGEGAAEVKLKLVRFSKVNHLHILFDRPGSDACALSSVKFFGTLVQATADLKELGKKEAGH